MSPDDSPCEPSDLTEGEENTAQEGNTDSEESDMNSEERKSEEENGDVLVSPTVDDDKLVNPLSDDSVEDDSAKSVGSGEPGRGENVSEGSTEIAIGVVDTDADSSGSNEGSSDQANEDEDDDTSDGILSWILSSAYNWGRDSAIGLGLVLGVLLVMFLATGMWPPMTAVESGSMHPNIATGDMVIVSDTDRYASTVADDTGIVTWEVGKENGVENFGDYGSVIVFHNPESRDTIHRAMFKVEKGEDWFERGEIEYMHGAESCESLRNCPAPRDGYITKGDNNDYYDQALGSVGPVKEDWVMAEAEFNVPYIGYLRVLGSWL